MDSSQRISPVEQSIQGSDRRQSSGTNQPQASLVDAEARHALSTNRTSAVESGEIGADRVAVAEVNGFPIDRREWQSWLIRSYGLAVLNELAVLHEARRLAAKLNLTVGRAEVDREYTLLLEKLENAGRDREIHSRTPSETKELLESVLNRQGRSLASLELGLERNAYLRAISEVEVTVTPDEIEEEFDRRYGTRATVHFIRYADLGLIPDNRPSSVEEFDREFARIAAARVAGVETGTLGPFGENDSLVPRVVTQAAFQIGIGKVSLPLLLDDGFAIIRVIDIQQGGAANAPSARDEIYRTIRAQSINVQMELTYRKLLSESKISIKDSEILGAMDPVR